LKAFGFETCRTFVPDSALAHDLTVVTRNVKHFESMGVRVVNPFAV